MTEIVEKTRRRLAELGATAPEALPSLFSALRKAFDAELAAVTDADAWKSFRDRWQGRKQGLLTHVKNNWLQPAPPDLKREVGKHMNALRQHVESALAERQDQLEAQGPAVPGDAFDLTLPGQAARQGARHLITQTLEEICGIFSRIGFSVVEGPEVETPYYNFEALNIPADHPARDSMDTLYLDVPVAKASEELRGARSQPHEPLLLRSHTSPMQIRTMEKQPPPVRIVVPGKVYRRDNPDATHSFMFHQVEGLAVDSDITFCDFKGTIEYFLHEFFGPQMQVRLRPSYFSFTEPSAEVDGSCVFCKGKGCRICKQVGWIELFGAGMVDPAVFEFVGYDPAQVCGFAFGIGVDRFAMLKYGIDDLQLFFQNDVRFAQQFAR